LLILNISNMQILTTYFLIDLFLWNNFNEYIEYQIEEITMISILEGYWLVLGYPKYPEKTPDLLKVNDKLYHIML
jgi:hypothetical protein